jgi:hypothetical protein
MPKTPVDFAELSELSTIFTSRGFRQLLLVHKEYLQKEVNRFVREQSLIQAYGVLCKFDDLEKIMELIEKRIVELKKEG